jgi:hypothetical protein
MLIGYSVFKIICMRNANTTAVIIIALLVTTCKKQDYCPEPPKADSTCDLMQSSLDYTYQEETYNYPAYQKAYDASGRVTKVVAVRYTYARDDSTIMALKYKGRTVYFLDEKNQTDTILIASFDAKKRLLKMAMGNVDADETEFVTFQFTYEGDRLSSYASLTEFEGAIYEDKRLLTYDTHGNIIRIYGPDFTETEGVFYTYDLSVTAKRQWYSDEFDGWWYNTVYLAQFLGWLPDLMPVNKRLTSIDIVQDSEDDPEEIPNVDNVLTNHVYDEHGNLLSYKAGDYKYTNTWNCTKSETHWPN